MTIREATEPKATGASEKPSGERESRSDSENASGEQSDPRAYSDPRGSEEPEAMPSGSSEDSSGERSEPRDDDSGEDQSCDECDEFYTPGTVDDVIALDTEHEARVRADGGGDVSIDIANHDTPSAPDSLFGEGPDDPEPEDSAEEDEEVEPVELLVQLAKEGEIDPWDIDIVEVTDKFLDALDDADLRTSGRALFYASVLLRMKSDVLLEEDQPEEEEMAEADWDPWADAPDDGEGLPPSYDPVNALESEMNRRLERQTARGKPETLDELVRDLRDAERGSWWKTSRTYDTSDSPRGFSRGVQELDYRTGDDFRMDDEPTQEEAMGTAHDEDMETTIDEVHAVILEHYRDGRSEILFEEISDAGPSRVETFLALLFLAHRGAIRLLQEEMFGDLWIQDPGAIEKAAASLGIDAE